MGFSPVRTLDNWKTQAFYAAPLGPKAIEDTIREIADNDDVDVAQVVVNPIGKKVQGYEVTVSHRDKGCDQAQTLQITTFKLVNSRPKPITDWQEALEDMKQRQAEMPPHLRGRPINVSRQQYDHWLDEIRKVTGYDGLAYGDIWVHWEPKTPTTESPFCGTLSFGHLTRWGLIAYRKYTDTLKLPPIKLVPINMVMEDDGDPG